MNEPRIITVGELREQLRNVPDDWEITFGGALEFDKLEQRGEKLVDLEFRQTLVLGPKGNWHILPKSPAQRSPNKKKPDSITVLARRQAAKNARKAG